jgi:hypothetical protein
MCYYTATIYTAFWLFVLGSGKSLEEENLKVIRKFSVSKTWMYWSLGFECFSLPFVLYILLVILLLLLLLSLLLLLLLFSPVDIGLCAKPHKFCAL